MSTGTEAPTSAAEVVLRLAVVEASSSLHGVHGHRNALRSSTRSASVSSHSHVKLTQMISGTLCVFQKKHLVLTSPVRVSPVGLSFERPTDENQLTSSAPDICGRSYARWTLLISLIRHASRCGWRQSAASLAPERPQGVPEQRSLQKGERMARREVWPGWLCRLDEAVRSGSRARP